MALARVQSLKKYPFILLGLWFTGAIFLIFWSMYFSDGNLIYTLDDPYIHLAVAENILQGGYGINTGEYSAPSSSIIYPFLLALTEWLGFGIWGPLAINMLAMAGAVYIVGRIIQEYVLTSNEQTSEFVFSTYFLIGLGLSACLILNGWGLVMTGMEHALHILAVLLVMWGFLKNINGDSIPPSWLIVAIVALPLIRFEGLAMALLSVAALTYLGHGRAAFFTALLIFSSLFFWFMYMQALGLPALPSSVLLKSGIAANMSGDSGLVQFSWSVLHNFSDSLNGRQGVLLLLAIMVVSALSWQTWKNGDRQHAVVIGGLAVLTGLAHAFFGHYGWLSRYEIYAMAVVIISGLVLGRTHLVHAPVRMGVTVALLLLTAPYALDTLRTPLASRNIYQQQYQMHRFATEYWKKPVAVNDLGWVSYNNPSFVLDLWGLGSEEVRRIRFRGELDAHALDALVIRRHIALIMIYDDWFKGVIPNAWKKVAVLNTSHVTSAGGKVDFYLTANPHRQEIIDLLNQFGKTLPKGASLNVEQ